MEAVESEPAIHQAEMARRELDVMQPDQVLPFFERDEDQRDDGEYELHALGAKPGRLWRLPPLRRGKIAQAPNLPEDDEVDERSQYRKHHHGEAQPISMKAINQGCRAGGQHQRADADRDPQSVHGGEEGADTLEHGKYKAGPRDGATSPIPSSR